MTTHLIIMTGKDTKPETLQTVWLHQWLIQIFSCYVFFSWFVLLTHGEKESSSFFVKQECLPANACFTLIFTFQISSTCYACTSTEIKIWILAFDNSLRSLNKLPGSLHHLSDDHSPTDFPIHLQFFSIKEKQVYCIPVFSTRNVLDYEYLCRWVNRLYTPITFFDCIENRWPVDRHVPGFYKWE